MTDAGGRRSVARKVNRARVPVYVHRRMLVSVHAGRRRWESGGGVTHPVTKSTAPLTVCLEAVAVFGSTVYRYASRPAAGRAPPLAVKFASR